MILDAFPTAEEFYKTYWGKKPFIVRNFIPTTLIESLIDGDTLAGLALEEDIKSRFITNNKQGTEWSCEHGPFDEKHFGTLGEENWSLLVQNVEQYHTDTAKLLTHFQFSPRWLLDDVMVSFSAPGGSVGPHTDSYHTFLVQGIGKRAWKISANRVDDDNYAENPDMKVLKNSFDGETFEVTAGDVIYMPPFFGHEGKTIDAAMTFSVGFLGPKLSEMLGDYAQYLDEHEELNKRYLGENLDTNSTGFSIAPATQEAIRGDALTALQSDDFGIWMAAYFSLQTHEDIEDTETSNEKLLSDDLLSALQNGDVLARPEHIKLAITKSSQGGFHLSVHGEILHIPATQKKLVEILNLGQDISLKTIEGFGDKGGAMTFITALYNKNVLSLNSHDE